MTTENNIRNDGQSPDKKLKETFGTGKVFTAPDGYFESLPDRIINRVVDKEAPAVISFHERPVFRIIAAAASVLIIVAVAISLYFSPEETEEDIYSEFSTEELYDHSLSHLAELEEEYLLSMMDIEDLEEILSIDLNENTISEEEIIDYLLAENNIEELILNEY